MTETLANGYSSESAPRELSNEYQQDRVWMVFQKSLHLCALDESSLSIGRVKYTLTVKKTLPLHMLESLLIHVLLILTCDLLCCSSYYYYYYYYFYYYYYYYYY